MKSKKLVSVLLVLGLVTTLFSGCGKKETQTEGVGTDSASDSAESEAGGGYLTAAELYKGGVADFKYKAGEFKKYEDTLHLTFGRPIDFNATELVAMAEAGEPVENNRWIQYYRDALNIECEYGLTNASGGDYNQQILLAMSAGELPDIFQVYDLSMLSQLAEAGAIWDLTEIYQDNVNETLGNLLESEGTAIYSTGMYDNRLYAIPQKMPSTNAYDHCWVRRDWLEEQGLDVPETMDDVKNIARTFVDNYEDNIGLMFSNSYMFEYQAIFWAFGGGDNNSRDQWLLQPDGKLAYSEVQPEMKEGLKWLNDMYESGLINPEWSTEDTYAALNNYVATNRCGIFFGPHWYGFSLQAFEQTMDESADWISCGIPTGKEGVEIQVKANNVVDGWLCVNKDCENPEAVIQLLNAYSEKLFGANNDFENFFACKENSSLRKATPLWTLSATVDLDPCESMIRAYDPETGVMKEEELEGAGKTYWNYIKEDMSAYKYMFGPVDSCFSFVHKTYPDIILWNQYQGAPTPTQNDRWSSMQEMIDTYCLKMINGEIEIDSGFDEMVQKWNELGGTQVTAEVNEMYASFNE